MKKAKIVLEVDVVDNATEHDVRNIGKHLIADLESIEIKEIVMCAPQGQLDLDFLRGISRIIGGVEKSGPTGQPIIAMLTCGHPQEITRKVWETWCGGRKPKHRFIQCNSCLALYKREHAMIPPSVLAEALARTPVDDGEALPYVLRRKKEDK